MNGLTLDAGALIALERRRSRVLRIVRAAYDDRRIVTAPAVAVAEWWRGRTDTREAIVRGLHIEPIDIVIAKAAGGALAAVPRATLADAIVAASAARRGDIVLTTDPHDMLRLAAHFRAIRVLAI